MDTPYKDLLSDDECRQVRDFLVAPINEVAELTLEMNHLQVLPSQFTRKQDDLNELIDCHLALLSPARKLPYNIVQEIFKAASAANGHCTMSLTDSPLQISHVCRDW
ncbi:hypothetical protein B0H17DRAFT_1045821 [Mycena rosella]|uniref:F-box domain-containing protein n=1 Tax=Mycena rosella TaxID=1033263 RepID=A0AAD7DWP3_MYCRO|nr:hypothetical protein B0H17DRAFT_1045821 [Mycena rosella]